MAKGEIVACEAAFFRAEDESDALGTGSRFGDARNEIGKGDDGLLGLAVSEGSGADDEGAAGDCFLQVLRAAGILKQALRLDGGFGFAPVRLIRRDNREPEETEVRYGPRRGSNIERVAG